MSDGVVRATRVSFLPGAMSFTCGKMPNRPRCRPVRPLNSCHFPWSVKPHCWVPALVSIDRKPCSSPSVTHSAHPSPVPPDSGPRSATGVTGPRKNGTLACWPARYVASSWSWEKLRKLAFTEV